MKRIWASSSIRTKKQAITAIYILYTLALANSTLALYGSFIVLVLYYSFTVLFNSLRLGFPKQGWHAVDIVPLLFIASWFYGAVIGLIRGNEFTYVFANFAGFLTYFSYYLLIWSGIGRIAVLNLLLMSALVICLVNVALALSYILFSVDVWNEPIIQLIYGSYIGGSSTGQIRMYSTSQLVALPLFSVALMRLILSYKEPGCSHTVIDMRSSMAAFSYLALSAIVTIIMPASKGFMLAILVIIFIVFTYWSNRKTRGLNIKKLGFATAFIVLLSVVLSLTGYINIVSAIFSESDEGNITRYLQLSDLIDDMNLVGQGLGAVVPGNIRDEERPYGFELSYINLIHKLGLVSVLAFVGYLLSIKKIISYGKSLPINLNYAAAALGGMGFVFVGIGNPVISSPQLVLLHCISLFLIREPLHYPPQCRII